MKFDRPRPLEPPQPWKEDAACRGTNLDWFFPGRKEPAGTTAKARRICAACPVKAECLEYAIEYDMPGIWGGTTRKQRLSMRKRAA